MGKRRTLEEMAIVSKYLEKFREDTNIIKKMMSNADYIEWLNQFTQDKDGFSNEDWLFFPEEISKSDKEKVEQLHLFYYGIAEYAKQNGIYPIPCGSGRKYKQCCGK